MSFPEYGVRSTDAIADLANGDCTSHRQPGFDAKRGPSKHADVFSRNAPVSKKRLQSGHSSVYTDGTQTTADSLAHTLSSRRQSASSAQKGPEQGLFLNTAKTRLFWSCQPANRTTPLMQRVLRENYFKEGIDLLGASIGSRQFLENVLKKKIDRCKENSNVNGEWEQRPDDDPAEDLTYSHRVHFVQFSVEG